MADALTTQRDMSFKLSISQDIELTMCKISVYFNNIGLGQQLIVELMTRVPRAGSARYLSRYELVCWGVFVFTKHMCFHNACYSIPPPTVRSFNDNGGEGQGCARTHQCFLPPLLGNFRVGEPLKIL